MIIVGIDPGLTGAIATSWPNGNYEVADIPTMAKGKGRVKTQVNPAGLVNILKHVQHWENEPVQVIVERINAMPGQGVASMFSMGDTFGCIRGVCAGMLLPIQIITPPQWKKHYKVGSDKEVVRARAIELFPDQPLSRKKDHNRAEALLIAKFGRDQLRLGEVEDGKV